MSALTMVAKASAPRALASLMMLGLALIVGLPQAQAQERTGGVIAELDVQVTQVNDAGFDLIEADDYLTSVSLGAGYDLSAQIPGLSALFLYQISAADFDQGQRLGKAPLLSWSQSRFMLAAEYGPELWGFFRPFGRAGAGYALQSLSLMTGPGAQHDYAHDLAGFGALGFELFMPTGLIGSSPDSAWLKHVKIGLHGQYGYMLQSDAQFDELESDPDSLSEDDPWQREPTQLGSLNTSGMFWSFGAMLRVSF